MKLGLHVTISKGIENTPLEAHKRGAEVFMMFSRSPQGGNKKELTPELIEKFNKNLKKTKITEFYIHAPYFINLGSSNKRIYLGSIGILRDVLERGSLLGAKYMMFHVGSGKDLGRKKGLKQSVKGIKEILKNYNGSTQLLIENSAGAGEILCDKFDEIGLIIKKVKNKNLGICFDTCHAFASGYDLRDKKTVDKTIKDFDKMIGLDKLKILHFNDSKVDLGANRDRHEIIGQGFLGKDGFKAIINHPKLKKLNGVLETSDVRDAKPKSLLLLKKLRRSN